ncbi:hypothetical protein scyTo_0002958 [Scyliorhinus torazame]|uniref:Uncharacterized protein n=1 Tax=Scyliorhinus torazame TaxID=75743 RepID=A0A401PL60_SCYTO|nr:hypothetical protein [Scyliorhinus torazame]
MKISEITKRLFVWESNYSKLCKADTKLEADLQNIEQDTELKDERIRELNHTIEALWITADELADRKVDLTIRIGKLQNEIKEKHDLLSKSRKEETVDTQAANMPRRIRRRSQPAPPKQPEQLLDGATFPNSW